MTIRLGLVKQMSGNPEFMIDLATVNVSTHVCRYFESHPRRRATSPNYLCSYTWWSLHPVLLIILTLTGCGDGFSSVTGQIKLDGNPLAGGENVAVTIMFYPESGRGSPAAALADESGNYALSTGARKGLPPGNYVVTLSASEFTPPTVAGGMPTRKDLTPARYTNPKLSGLRAEVKPGRNTFDFDLSSTSDRRS